jgi:hypothetical protein
VWLTVTDPDSHGTSAPAITIHWQRLREPKRGMVYDVPSHIASIEDTRRHGENRRLLFYPFFFNLGSLDSDQAVTPAPAPQLHESAAVHRDVAFHDKADGQGGRSFAPRRRNLFQRLCWPTEKGCSRECSPRRENGESSRHTVAAGTTITTGAEIGRQARLHTSSSSASHDKKTSSPSATTRSSRLRSASQPRNRLAVARDLACLEAPHFSDQATHR